MGSLNFQDLRKGCSGMNKIISKFTSTVDWIWKLIVLNILWCLFTFSGLVIFGLFPATTAMFSIMRKWIIKKETPHLFREFWSCFKSEFNRSNIFGLFFWSFVYFIRIDWKFVQSLDSSVSIILYATLISTLLGALLILIYLFPLIVHYEISFFNGIKKALILAILNPLITIGMVCAVLVLYYLFSSLPILIPLMVGSTYCLVFMKGSYIVIVNNEKKLQGFSMESDK